MITNPFLDSVNRLPASEFDFMTGYRTFSRSHHGVYNFHRDEHIKEYAWAIPSEEALEAIVKFSSSIFELGAGTGYWAYMLTQYGANVVAYDICPPVSPGLNHWKHEKIWFNVQPGDVLHVTQNQHRTLFLCWPPYKDMMADTALSLYKGKKFIYIGEGDGGCTGSDEFHMRLEVEYNLIERIVLPQWEGIHDALYLYERK